jgi:hypothetical protein
VVFEKQSNNQRGLIVARGGVREGAGRKAGSASKLDQEARAAVMASGEETPLEFLLRTMRTSEDPARQLDAAKAAAPYVHARLANVEVRNPDGESFKHEFTWAG